MPKAVADNIDEESGVTWDSYVDLGKPPGITVVPASALDEGGTYICSTYVLGRPFVMSGNVVGACASCEHPIQMRPHAPEALRKICITCALSEGVKMPEIPKKLR